MLGMCWCIKNNDAHFLVVDIIDSSLIVVDYIMLHLHFRVG